MAKSLRSKGARKNRATKREHIFEPVLDARLARLAVRLGSDKKEPQHEENRKFDDVVSSVEASAMQLTMLKKDVEAKRRGRKTRARHQKAVLPNPYGLTKREMLF